ncbi:hypothetical protein TWF106_008046 [Orbilia oligospora]|uniref:Uncharacterized protein n=1 Tax=Orbilia oligospora TaxID=2813651 RepID=A0A7C8QPS3_ORBOL|nr:hypothetical protein TWF106_008046 [Orbilia oligospora]
MQALNKAFNYQMRLHSRYWSSKVSGNELAPRFSAAPHTEGKKPRVGLESTQSSAAADPSKDATADPLSHRSTSQLRAVHRRLDCDTMHIDTATLNLEWSRVANIPEAFLVDL